jgi:hypothetical protein
LPSPPSRRASPIDFVPRVGSEPLGPLPQGHRKCGLERSDFG